MRLIGDNRFNLDYKDPRPDSDYDSEQLKLGTEIEKEHINFSVLSKIIAKDHLDFHEYYYTVLQDMKKENNSKNDDIDKTKTIERINQPVMDQRTDDKYDKHELSLGIKVEMEHTNDPQISKMLAKDHLDKLPNYYTLLKKYNLINEDTRRDGNSVFNRIKFL